MFVQQDRQSSHSGVMADKYDTLMSYVEHTTPDSQIRYIADQMGVGSWGMAPYGMLFTIYKIACQVGGALFFFKTFISPYLRRVVIAEEEVKPPEADTEVRLTDRELYEQMLQKRPMWRRMWGNVRGW